MLGLTRESQLDKAKGTLWDVVSYADQVIKDERLRADFRAALGHGVKAGARAKSDIDAGGITTRLASDKRLRKNLRALLDDLDNASDRLRYKKGHRARNLLLIVAGAGAVLAAVPYVRNWLAQRMSEPMSGGMQGDTTV